MKNAAFLRKDVKVETFATFLVISWKSWNSFDISELIGYLGISRKPRNFSKALEFLKNLGIFRKFQSFSEI